MDLTKECIEEIVLAAKEVERGALTITIQSRTEDKKTFDFKCEYEKRYRVPREGRAATPTEMAPRAYPQDKL
jgi:hypothetical protein